MIKLTLEMLLKACADASRDNGIHINTILEPLSGPGGPVKPAIYPGGKYQMGKRWANPDTDEATPVILIDNTPSQANRLESALRTHRESSMVPELLLDLGSLTHLPPHLPREISSLQFPHRNADAYLRDSLLPTDGDGSEGEDFMRTELGKSIFDATATTCGPLIAWFPQALLFGFWQSHLGKKKANTKHARVWTSEIVGWKPATDEDVRIMGLKGDPLNLSLDESQKIQYDKEGEQSDWGIEKSGGKAKLSDIGHGQVPFGGDGGDSDRALALAAVSFARITQQATLSLAQLRRVSLGTDKQDADPAMRALLVALGLHAHQLAFGQGFALRSGAELQPCETAVTWIGAEKREVCDLGDSQATGDLLQAARENAEAQGVPMDGWGKQVRLLPKPNLEKAIISTWPDLEGGE